MRALLAGSLAILVLGGCGTSDDRDQARGVVTRFYTALDAHRPQVACAQLSNAAVQVLEQQEGRSCARAVGSLDLQGAPIVATNVYVTSAKVDLRGGESAFLGRESDGWKLNAVGCKPQDGKPRSRPLTCELKG